MRRLTCFLLLLTVTAGCFAFRGASASETVKLIYAFLALATSVTGMISTGTKRDEMLSPSVVRRLPDQPTASDFLSTHSRTDSYVAYPRPDAAFTSRSVGLNVSVNDNR